MVEGCGGCATSTCLSSIDVVTSVYKHCVNSLGSGKLDTDQRWTTRIRKCEDAAKVWGLWTARGEVGWDFAGQSYRKDWGSRSA